MSPTGTRKILFPRLKNLVVVLQNWRDSWDRLKIALAARKARGKGLERLVLMVFTGLIRSTETEILKVFYDVAEKVVCYDRIGAKVLFTANPNELAKLLRL